MKVRKTQEGGRFNRFNFFKTFLSVCEKCFEPKAKQSLFRVGDRVRMQRYKLNTERWRERDTQNNYTNSSHKMRVVQSPCTSKGFHYNLRDYVVLKHPSK